MFFQAVAMRDTLARALYGALFDWIVDQVLHSTFVDVLCAKIHHTHLTCCLLFISSLSTPLFSLSTSPFPLSLSLSLFLFLLFPLVTPSILRWMSLLLLVESRLLIRLAIYIVYSTFYVRLTNWVNLCTSGQFDWCVGHLWFRSLLEELLWAVLYQLCQWAAPAVLQQAHLQAWTGWTNMHVYKN